MRRKHVLLEGGRLALDALLPGFVAELKASGAPRLGMPSDMVQWQSGRWFRRTAATSYIYSGSRGQVEYTSSRGRSSIVPRRPPNPR
ncbi:hypothetical protein [Streptomyces sp. NBC_01794]|uniref:hypothetical protein n=1 Tax=unclassified Streptomyces TaxID=2593676 RepID=UPI003872D480